MQHESNKSNFIEPCRWIILFQHNGTLALRWCSTSIILINLYFICAPEAMGLYGVDGMVKVTLKGIKQRFYTKLNLDTKECEGSALCSLDKDK